MTLGRRAALSACFFAGGLGIGSWGANLPALGRKAALSEGELGVVLLFFAAGAVFAMTRAPWLIGRLGAGRSAVVAAALFGISISAVGLPQGIVAAALVGAMAGACFGTIDVTVNNEAVALERTAGRPILSSFHALFSLGTLVAASAYAGFVRAGLTEAGCMLVAGIVVVAIAAASWPTLHQPAQVWTVAEPAHEGGVAPCQSLRPVLLLGGMAFLAFFAEGAILDWIAVYVVRVVEESESAGAIAYAVFASAMTLGRFGGDLAKRLMGGVPVFRLSAVLVIAGFGLALSMPVYPVILVGMSLGGLGAANLAPLIFSAAGVLREGDGGRAMSQVLTMGYAGILIGPAIIGFVAEFLGLTVSLWMVVAALCLLVLGGRLLQPKG